MGTHQGIANARRTVVGIQCLPRRLRGQSLQHQPYRFSDGASETEKRLIAHLRVEIHQVQLLPLFIRHTGEFGGVLGKTPVFLKGSNDVSRHSPFLRVISEESCC